MTGKSPGELEVYGYFSKHLGPGFQAAGLRIQFHYNQPPGIHFKVKPTEEYRDAILRGLRDGIALRFPEFPASGSIWVTEVTEHPVDSSGGAFYLAARMAIDQASSVAVTGTAEPPGEENAGSPHRSL